ncbi:MAG: oligosaccharide flippase family protein [Alphaproteobacteria bacterium]|nr:oligosaccharide flippase family protein [Alphaproteobacteria bacterium]
MRAILLTLFTTGGLQAINLIGSILAARLLLPEGRGEFAAAMLWPTTIAYLVVIGLNDAVMFFSANGRLPARRVFANALWLGVAVSLIGIGLGWWVALPLAYEGMRSEVVEAARLLLLIIPCHILGMVFQEMLRGHMRLGVWNALRLSLGGVYVLAVAGVWLLFDIATVTSFAVAWLVAHIIPTLVAAALCLAAGWGGWRPDRPASTELVSYGLKIHTSNVVGMMNGRVDQMLIQQNLAPAALGLYVVAVNLAQLTATLANSVAMIAFPRACAADVDSRPAVIGLYLRLTLGLMLATTGGLALLAPLALSLLWGPAFAEASDLVRVLLLGVIPLALKDFAVLTFKAYDRALALNQAEVASLVLNGVLLWWLVPAHGLMGAAIAYVVTRWAAALYLGWLVRSTLGLSLSALLRPTRADWYRLTAGLATLRQR